MNWPYYHIVINHFPIILTILGCAAVGLGLIGNRRTVWLYAVATLTLAGLSAYPVFYTGGAAAHALHGTWYVVPAMVHEHSAAANFALITLLIMGGISGYTWRQMVKPDVVGLPKPGLRALVAVVAVFTLTVVVRTAYLGGLIVHDSPKLQNPPAAVMPPQP